MFRWLSLTIDNSGDFAFPAEFFEELLPKFSRVSTISSILYCLSIKK
jgi:hypothetical protein